MITDPLMKTLPVTKLSEIKKLLGVHYTPLSLTGRVLE
jgi:hypothetical protein